MTKHMQIETRSAAPLETREDDPLAAATQAVEEMRAAVEERNTAHQTEVRALNERLATMETRLNRPGQQTENRDEPTQEVRSFGIYLRRGEGVLTDIERRALTVGVDATAGFLAPETYSSEIIKSVTEHSPIRQYAKVVSISGSEFKIPKRVSGTNAQWVSEIGDRPESTPIYGQLTLTPGELATFVEVSKQLLEDSAYDLEAELRDAFAEDFAAKEGAAFVSGDGNGKPKGILTDGNGIATVASGAAATLGTAPGDTLIGLFSSLPTAYAQNGAWLMNRNTLAAIRKVKDTTGGYIWQPSLQDGLPSTLLGRPVIEDVTMPNIAAGTFPIVFGDFSGYRIVDRVGVSVLVDPYTRAKNGITVFHARMRVGGDVTNPDHFVKLKVAAS